MNPVLALVAAAVPVAVGLLVLRAHHSRLGWLLVAHGVCFGALLSFDEESSSGVGAVVDQLAAGSWLFLFLWLALIAYLLPDGHTASGFWRRWVQLGLAGVAAFLVGAAGDAESFRDAHDGADPPVPWLPEPVSGLLGLVGLILTVLLVSGSGFAVRARLRDSSGDTRLQLLWLVWGATSLPASLVLVWVGHFGFHDGPLLVNGGLVLAGTALPLTIGVAILRHRLFDIQVVLSRTLTYGVLVALVVAVYALLLLGADRLTGESTVGGLIAVGIVAVAVHPAYAVVRSRIERWVYGYRSDPATALRRLGDDVESADPLHVVETITASIADALKVGRCWVEAPGATAVETLRTMREPLVHRGDHIGDLVVEAPSGRTLSAADSTLLRDLARHAAVTVRAAQLAEDVQASRSRIVTAREEERKRLRRDLHDGVGPLLAAILLKVQAVQSRSDNDQRNALLAEIRHETKSAITEVRRVVDDLRPPAIDEVGLLGAIRQRAATLSSTTMLVIVYGPDDVPPLPAAVEVAAYRIVTEALTNVTKHSGAGRCVVDLGLDDTLSLTVTDNGCGQPTGSLASNGIGNGVGTGVGTGVGWTSMVERAAELGGSCSISNRAEGGLVVRATLPLRVHTGTEAVR